MDERRQIDSPPPDGPGEPEMLADPPRPHIDPDELEDLAASGCTPAEVAAWFRCSVAQLRERLKDPVLGGIWKQRRARGRAHLRRAQYKLAEKNAVMARLLGETILGHDRGKGARPKVRTGIDRDRPLGE